MLHCGWWPTPPSCAARARKVQVIAPDKQVMKYAYQITIWFILPDMPHGWNEFDNRWFSTTLGFAPIVDYTGFSQDNDSITQVGRQDGRWDIRSGRFSLRGQIHTRRPINYFLSLEYKGLDRPPEAPSCGIRISTAPRLQPPGPSPASIDHTIAKSVMRDG